MTSGRWRRRRTPPPSTTARLGTRAPCSSARSRRTSRRSAATASAATSSTTGTRVAACNPAYGKYVEGERERLGETHPIFLTQYCLKLIAGGGRLLSASQRAQLAGDHERRSQPDAGDQYVAGLDLAGGDDGAPSPDRDATVLTIGRIVQPPSDAIVQEPRVEIVEHIAWTGEPHEALLPRLIDLLRDTWRVARVAIDATGIGETAARLIAQALGDRAWRR